MFNYYQKSFFINQTIFSNDPKIASAIFKLERTKNKKRIYPYVNTSSGKSKSVLLGKLHNEFLERFKMVNNDKSNKKVKIIKLNNFEILLQDRNVLGYDYDSKYGMKDTTGTASGLNSKILIEKAVCELIEKNELMLMWYKKLTKIVDISDYINSVLMKYGINRDVVKIFYSQNISNIHTVIIFIFNRYNEIIGSGISGSKDINDALISSIEEALMQIWVNLNAPSPIYTKNSKKLKTYFLNLCKAEIINIENLKSVQNIKIIEEFNDIEIALLNIAGLQREITIKALSESMFNCIPSLVNIKKNKDKKIVKYFDIMEDFKNKVECEVI